MTIKKRVWEQEDLEHVDEALDQLIGKDGCISMPGLESVRDQIALRLDVPTRFKNHDEEGQDG